MNTHHLPLPRARADRVSRAYDTDVVAHPRSGGSGNFGKGEFETQGADEYGRFGRGEARNGVEHDDFPAGEPGLQGDVHAAEGEVEAGVVGVGGEGDSGGGEVCRDWGGGFGRGCCGWWFLGVWVMVLAVDMFRWQFYEAGFGGKPPRCHRQGAYAGQVEVGDTRGVLVVVGGGMITGGGPGCMWVWVSGHAVDVGGGGFGWASEESVGVDDVADAV